MGMLGEQATTRPLDAGKQLASHDWAACFQSMGILINHLNHQIILVF